MAKKNDKHEPVQEVSKNADQLKQVRDKIDQLDRQILILKHTENWSYQQLADRLGVSLNTVEYRLLQARKRLRAELSRSTERESTSLFPASTSPLGEASR